MKTKTITTICLVLLMLVTAIPRANGTEIVPEGNDTLRLIYAQGMEKLANSLADEYSHSKKRYIDVVAATAIADITADNILYLTNSSDSETSEGRWKISVGKDIVVPVMLKANPYYERVRVNGISAPTLARMVRNSGTEKWSDIFSGTGNETVTVYATDDNLVTGKVYGFLGLQPEDAKLVKVASSEEVLARLKADKYGIAFLQLAEIANVTEAVNNGEYLLMPIDRNGNGVIDRFEDIYENGSSLARGVWIGKYPQKLVSEICVEAKGNTAGTPGGEFVEWIISAGQPLVAQRGYSELIPNERLANLSALNQIPVSEIQPVKAKSKLTLIIVVAGLIVGFVLLFELVFARRKRSLNVLIANGSAEAGNLREDSILAPAGIFFDKTHTWAFMEKSGEVRVGVDDFLMKVTGAISRVELKKKGSKVSKGEKFMTIIQSGKQIDLYSPVTGVIVTGNEALAHDAALLGKSPLDEGWVYLIKPTNWLKEIGQMYIDASYKKWLEWEFTRLKDFIAMIIAPSGAGKKLMPVFQDGGEFKVGVLDSFGPEIWEEFQSKFIDASK